MGFRARSRRLRAKYSTFLVGTKTIRSDEKSSTVSAKVVILALDPPPIALICCFALPSNTIPDNNVHDKLSGKSLKTPITI